MDEPPTLAQDHPPTAPRNWPLQVLTWPAFLGAGAARIPAPLHFRLRARAESARQALAEILRRSVALDWTVAAPPAAPVFSVVLGSPGADAATDLLVSLDEPAARAIVDVLERECAGVRGCGALTEAELGLLEFAALELADRLLLDPGSTGGLALRAFRGGGEPGEAAPEPTLPLHLLLRVAGRCGHVTLHLPPRFLTTPTATALADALAAVPGHGELSRPVPVHLCLPPIHLAEADGAPLAADDIVLLGARELTHLGNDCQLVTDTGWRLCAARIVADSGTVTTVECDGLEPSADAITASSAQLTACLGETVLDRFQLVRWHSGVRLDVRRPEGALVTLRRAGAAVALGELVRVGDELGIQVHAPEVAPETTP